MQAQHNLYDLITPLVKRIKALDTILEKLQTHCTEHNIADAVFLNDRLYPNMLPFASQVRIVTDFTKGAASRLTGSDIPKFEDNEATIAQLRDRIAALIAHLDTFNASQFEGADSKDILLKLPGDRELKFNGWDYMNDFVLPNVYFHLTTAYNILRHRGVGLGKVDFLGG
ncbi:hypothetical protein DTO96_101983 [Ephemeroptericola cinctiostellae]|uniref:DUF1993 domain-containing protein n=1 Tax=Ephemeroptericola cinctiostellae TaxID=2268024 RepID=A0A345DCZ9_9BURK|nr:DUF1993 domain-containing protein [Ephemeroptericola cinctiostellae]AXF86237.1 hypothetical protein DTO96_101983 [Ephemeroptericola cinctiostellae]